MIKYIDLFSGIGGFHQAMNNISEYGLIDTECVFASEIDKYAIETYRNNYNIDSNFNIKNVNPEDIGHYDLLCAGFPCQAFSKAGSQSGFNDETKGTLFFEIERLLEYRVKESNPVKYILLENVANLVTHDKGKTWKIIKKHLQKLGYLLSDEPLLVSPHQLGIPQLRNRVFIVGIHENYSDKLNIDISDLPPISKRNITNVKSILDNEYDKLKDKDCILDKEELQILDVWDQFKKGINRNVIGFPIWSDEFKKKYNTNNLPLWKKRIVEKNRTLYVENKIFIDSWLKKNHKILKSVSKTKRKFEWQAGEHIDSIYEGIIQFRTSGVRVKRPTEVPALVAMVHIPIYGPEKRKLTVKEVSRLQSFPENFKVCDNSLQAYKQFGNSVNVDVVTYIIKKLILNN